MRQFSEMALSEQAVRSFMDALIDNAHCVRKQDDTSHGKKIKYRRTANK